MTNIDIKTYKKRALPTSPIPNSVYYILPNSTNEVIVYITDQNGVPIKIIDLTGGTGNIISVTGTGVTGTASNPKIDIATFISTQLGNQVYLSTDDGKLQVNQTVSPDASITVTATSTELQIQLASSIVAQINSALQPGDNVSELVNDANYITANNSNIAGENISSGMAVVIWTDGLIYKYNTSNINHAGLSCGISKTSALTGENIIVVFAENKLTEAGSGWSSGKSYFIGANSLLTIVPPSSGISKKIATGIGVDTILINNYPEHILL